MRERTPEPEAPPDLNVKAVARDLQTTVQTVLQLIRAGRLKARRLPPALGGYAVCRASYELFIAEPRTPTTGRS
jgi:hypothetical protein